MLYVLGGILALLAAAWFLRSSISLQKRDEYAARNPVDDATAHQTLVTIHQDHYQGPT